MAKSILSFFNQETFNLDQAGLLRRELLLTSGQGPSITLGKKQLVNFVSADYLGLSNHAAVKAAGARAMERLGAGLGAPRMTTGTLPIHLDLEAALAEFLGTDETLVYPAAYLAYAGLFESLAGERDYIFCDEHVHPGIADGVRLSRAHVLSFRNNDMNHLEDRLRRSRAARFRIIVTEAVSDLDGVLAPLEAVCELAARFEALVVVNDPHGAGVMGKGGCGTAACLGVSAKVDIVTGTLGFALGSAGGFVAGRREVVTWLRQKSRPYLSACALTPPSVAAALQALAIIRAEPEHLEQLRGNVTRLRNGLQAHKLRVADSVHPIVSVLIGEAVATQRLVDGLFRRGIYVMGFCHPVVPEGAARIRLQVVAGHTQKVLDKTVAAFAETARELRLV